MSDPKENETEFPTLIPWGRDRTQPEPELEPENPIKVLEKMDEESNQSDA